MGQPLEHLANEVYRGVKTHPVGPDIVTNRWELWNVTVQRTRTPISTDSPSGDGDVFHKDFRSLISQSSKIGPLVGL